MATASTLETPGAQGFGEAPAWSAGADAPRHAVGTPPPMTGAAGLGQYAGPAQGAPDYGASAYRGQGYGAPSYGPPGYGAPGHGAELGYRPPSHDTAAGKASNTLSVIAFVCGGIALLFFPIVFGPAGIVCAAVGLSRRERLAAPAMATAVIGMIVGFVLGAIVWGL